MLTFLAFLILSPFITFIIISFFAKAVFAFQKPRLDRVWPPLFSNLPSITISNDQKVLIQNVRHAKYNPHNEFEHIVNFENKKYDLNNLERLWLYVIHYAPFQSHIIFSFEFSNGLERNYLTISYEVRKKILEDFHAWKVLFKNYEGHYIVSPEEDVVYLRTDIRQTEQVYLYPLKIGKDHLHNIFKNLALEINKYSKKAFFYRFSYRNCLTEVLKFLKNENLLKYTQLSLLDINHLIYKSEIVDIENLNTIGYDVFRKKARLYKYKDLIVYRNHFYNRIRDNFIEN